MKLSVISVTSVVLIPALYINVTLTDPYAYEVCQTECAVVIITYYGSAGFTWGVILGFTAPASIIVYNTAFGSCQAARAAVLLVPTP